jgi:hypothetical protein
MIPYSVLDLSPDPRRLQRRRCARQYARPRPPCGRDWGYRRYWLAEHHNSTGIASAATSILIGHVAGGHEDHPRRRRRHHAAQPCAAGHRRAVRHAGDALSRPHRSRSRPGARNRHGDRGRCAAAATSMTDISRTTSSNCSAISTSRRARPAGTAVPGVGTHVPVWILGIEPVSARSSPPISACPMPSRRILRRARWNRRRDLPPDVSNPSTMATSRISCWRSMSSPR